MRRLTPFGTYTRTALFSRAQVEQLGKSLLGFLAAGEVPLILMFVQLSGVNDPWKTS